MSARPRIESLLVRLNFRQAESAQKKLHVAIAARSRRGRRAYESQRRYAQNLHGRDRRGGTSTCAAQGRKRCGRCASSIGGHRASPEQKRNDAQVSHGRSPCSARSGRRARTWANRRDARSVTSRWRSCEAARRHGTCRPRRCVGRRRALPVRSRRLRLADSASPSSVQGWARRRPRDDVGLSCTRERSVFRELRKIGWIQQGAQLDAG